MTSYVFLEGFAAAVVYYLADFFLKSVFSFQPLNREVNVLMKEFLLRFFYIFIRLNELNIT